MEGAKVPGLDVPWQLQQLADAVIEQLFSLRSGKADTGYDPKAVQGRAKFRIRGKP
jgi:hypothetical protein